MCMWGCFCCLVTNLCPTLRNPTIDHQAPLSMGFPRQEYCSGLPFPSPGDLPDLGIESASLRSPALTGRFFTSVPPGKPSRRYARCQNTEKNLSCLCGNGAFKFSIQPEGWNTYVAETKWNIVPVKSIPNCWERKKNRERNKEGERKEGRKKRQRKKGRERERKKGRERKRREGRGQEKVLSFYKRRIRWTPHPCPPWTWSLPNFVVTITRRPCLEMGPKWGETCPVGPSRWGQYGCLLTEGISTLLSLHCGGRDFFQVVMSSEQRIKPDGRNSDRRMGVGCLVRKRPWG